MAQVKLAPYVNFDLASNQVGLEQDARGEHLRWNLDYNFEEVDDMVGYLRIVPLSDIVAEEYHIVDAVVVGYFAEAFVGGIVGQDTADRLGAGGNI